MSDTEDSVVADSVDSAATMSPSILRGLESLKSRPYYQTQHPVVNTIAAESHISIPVSESKDSQETQIPVARCDEVPSNDRSGSPEFPPQYPTAQKMRKVHMDDSGMLKADGPSASLMQPKIGIATCKPESDADEKKQAAHDDSQLPNKCLQSGCICKETIVSLEKLAEVQGTVHQLLRDETTDNNAQAQHLLRIMQQHLRGMTKMQQAQLQDLRQLMKQPPGSQPPDLKLQLKQIMAKKQRMLQLLKTHRTLASVLHMRTKESSAENRQQSTGGSHSDPGSLKSVASRGSTSMLAGTTKPLQHSSTNSGASTSSPMDHGDGNSGASTKPTQLVKTTASLAGFPTQSTALRSQGAGVLLVPQAMKTNVIQPSASGGVRNKWLPPYASAGNKSNQPQISTTSPDPTAYQARVSASKLNSATKVGGTVIHIASIAPATMPETANKVLTNNPISLKQDLPLPVNDINKIADAHLSHPRQTTGKSTLPAHKVVNIQMSQATTPLSAPKHKVQQGAARPSINLHIPSRSGDNQSSAMVFSFPTLANSPGNLNLPRSIPNSQHPNNIRTPINQPTSTGQAISQYYVNNLGMPGTLVRSQPQPGPPLTTSTTYTRFPGAIKGSQPTNGTLSSPYQSIRYPIPLQNRFAFPHGQVLPQETVPGSANATSYQPRQARNIPNEDFATSQRQQVEPTSKVATKSNGYLDNQPATQESHQVVTKPASVMQLLDGKLLQPGQDVLSFAASGDGQTYQASLDPKGFIIDKSRGCFSGPSHWIAAVTNRSVSSASKFAWKSVLFKGESLVSLQQQWAARQVPPSSNSSQRALPVVLESSLEPDESAVLQKDPILIMLASDLRVHLIMTEELDHITKEDWEDMPSHMYADIDRWD